MVGATFRTSASLYIVSSQGQKAPWWRAVRYSCCGSRPSLSDCLLSEEPHSHVPHNPLHAPQLDPVLCRKTRLYDIATVYRISKCCTRIYIYIQQRRLYSLSIDLDS